MNSYTLELAKHHQDEVSDTVSGELSLRKTMGARKNILHTMMLTLVKMLMSLF